MKIEIPQHLADKLAILARLLQQPEEDLVLQALEFWLRGDKGPSELLDSLCEELLEQLVNTSLAGGEPSAIKSLSSDFLEAVDLRGRVLAELRHHDGRTLPQIRRRFEDAIAIINGPKSKAMKLEDVKAYAVEAQQKAERCRQERDELAEKKLEWEARAQEAVSHRDDNLAKEAVLRVYECESEIARLEVEEAVFASHAMLLEHGLTLIERARE